MTTVTKKT